MINYNNMHLGIHDLAQTLEALTQGQRLVQIIVSEQKELPQVDVIIRDLHYLFAQAERAQMIANLKEFKSLQQKGEIHLIKNSPSSQAAQKPLLQVSQQLGKKLAAAPEKRYIQDGEAIEVRVEELDSNWVERLGSIEALATAALEHMSTASPAKTEKEEDKGQQIHTRTLARKPINVVKNPGRKHKSTDLVMRAIDSPRSEKDERQEGTRKKKEQEREDVEKAEQVKSIERSREQAHIRQGRAGSAENRIESSTSHQERLNEEEQRKPRKST